jgi:hypothetical protein
VDVEWGLPLAGVGEFPFAKAGFIGKLEPSSEYEFGSSADAGLKLVALMAW